MHNLYRNTMTFTGPRPWHKLGIQFEEEFTSAQAIAAARLDYPVSKEQLYRLRSDLGPGMVEPTEAYATINGHTQDVLGIVGDGYEVLQNQEAFDFFDILLKEAGGKLQTAGAIGKGEKVWMLAKLPMRCIICLSCCRPPASRRRTSPPNLKSGAAKAGWKRRPRVSADKTGASDGLQDRLRKGGLAE